MGPKAKLLLLNKTVSDIDTRRFRKDYVKFYANATDYLIQNLPFNESLIQHAWYLNPRNRTGVNSSNVLSSFALKPGRCVESVLSCIFCFEPHER